VARLVAFLRAINVGGHVVKMDALRGHFGALGFKDVETFIASGNVIFTSGAGDHTALERKIEKRLVAELGYEVATFLRTDAEVARIARYLPFPEAQMRAAGAVSVGFLGEAPSPADKKVILGLKTDNDSFHVNGSEVYWMCQTGQGESNMSNVLFEKAVKRKVTFRGVRTVARLAALLEPGGKAR
jgi:uncharacterized protein (DUF1697 family)